MLVFDKRNNDTNVIKIIFGEESFQQFYFDGCLNINLNDLLSKLDPENKMKNILSFSFCEREDELSGYIKSYMGIDNSVSVGSQNLDIRTEDINVASENNSNQKMNHNQKCPTCGSYALIDHEGNVKECEACMKINAYLKGKQAGADEVLKNLEMKSRKSRSKKEKKDVESEEN